MSVFCLFFYYYQISSRDDFKGIMQLYILISMLPKGYKIIMAVLTGNSKQERTVYLIPGCTRNLFLQQQTGVFLGRSHTLHLSYNNMTEKKSPLLGRLGAVVSDDILLPHCSPSLTIWSIIWYLMCMRKTGNNILSQVSQGLKGRDGYELLGLRLVNFT